MMIGKFLQSRWLWVKLVHHLVITKAVHNEHHQLLGLHHQLHLLQLHILGPHRTANKARRPLISTVQNMSLEVLRNAKI